ncbi:MAG: Crp/Fnr family transcriptional regulator [Anaerolineales bacterium]
MSNDHKLPDDLTNFLRSTELFRGMDERLLRAIAQYSRPFRLQEDQLLFTQDVQAHSFYIVYSGCISLFLAMPDGRELVINEMHPGDCFGELSLLTGQHRSTGAIAREPSTVLKMDRQTFNETIGREPELMRRILEVTASRLSKSSDRESALAFLSSHGKIARALLMLDSETEGENMVHVTQAELGTYTGLARQTVARILGEWRDEGLVATHRGRIEILKPSELIVLSQDFAG